MSEPSYVQKSLKEGSESTDTVPGKHLHKAGETPLGLSEKYKIGTIGFQLGDNISFSYTAVIM